MTTIVFSHTALGSFANEEIPRDYIHHHKIRKLFAALTKNSIERQINLDTKLGDILPKAMKVETPKGTAVWADYRRLKDDRDRIIHLKTCDREALHQGPTSIWEHLFSPDIPKYPVIAKAMITHSQIRRDEKTIPRWFKLMSF
jgi:hypothetical protein